MTHQNDYTFLPDLLEGLMNQGLDVVTELVQIVVNEAMRGERERCLQAGYYERTDELQGYANGYKPKTLNTRMGVITFAIPQVREGGFYPSKKQPDSLKFAPSSCTGCHLVFQGLPAIYYSVKYAAPLTLVTTIRHRNRWRFYHGGLSSSGRTAVSGA
jgi:hypothetical protein